jgi:hypothetical protein
MNLTITAFYGPKPPALLELITTLQAELAGQLGDGFAPYETGQVHATLVGLEGFRKDGKLINASLDQAGSADASMDLAGLFGFLRHTTLLPLQIRIGGFRAQVDYGFTSRGQTPYARSCVIDNGTVVVMGWPHDDSGFPLTLDRLRRACGTFNILHKYHRQPGDIDNDLFFVLGHLRNDAARPQDISTLEERLRQRMQEPGPLDLRLGPQQLAVVAYSDRTLPAATSQAFTLEQALDDPESLAEFYERSKPPAG